jgi:hypothetical protein
MPWVLFTSRFDFMPCPGVMQVFKPSDLPQLITTPAAKAAVASGAAILTVKKEL